MVVPDTCLAGVEGTETLKRDRAGGSRLPRRPGPTRNSSAFLLCTETA